MKSKAITTAGRIDEFRTALQQGIDGITRAAEVYVSVIDDDPKAIDAFKAKFVNSMSADMWAKFEAVGRKWTHPGLLLGGVAGGKKNTAIKRLPYSAQERVFNRERFPLLTTKGDTLMVDLLEASNDQVDQLCNGSHMRTVSEQKAWAESQAVIDKHEHVEVMPYRIEDGRVSFRRGCNMSKAEVRRLLKEL